MVNSEPLFAHPHSKGHHSYPHLAGMLEENMGVFMELLGKWCAVEQTLLQQNRKKLYFYLIEILLKVDVCLSGFRGLFIMYR